MQLTPAILSQAAEAAGYMGMEVLEVLKVTKREQDTVVECVFSDPEGSFGDDAPVGTLYVKQNTQGVLIAGF